MAVSRLVLVPITQAEKQSISDSLILNICMSIHRIVEKKGNHNNILITEINIKVLYNNYCIYMYNVHDYINER